MPFSSSISLIETTKCNTLIALALKNNNVVVFDVNAGNLIKLQFTASFVLLKRKFLYLGIERKCVQIESEGAIEQIKFLPIIISNKSLYMTNSPQIKIETRLMCMTSDGKLSLIDCTLGNIENPSVVFTPK
jgi:hypothetical protein